MMTEKMGNYKRYTCSAAYKVVVIDLGNSDTDLDCDDVVLSESPSFELANAKWCFQISPSEEEEDSAKKIALHVVRLNSEISQHVCYSFVVLKDDNDSDDDKGLDDNDKITFSHTFVYKKHDAKKNIGYFDYEVFSVNKEYRIFIIFFCWALVAQPKAIPSKMDKDLELLSQDFENLFLSGKNQDLTLRVGGKEFRVHRDVLMARSKVFKAMLTHDMIEKAEDVIDVLDSDPQTMKKFLKYVYSGKIEDLNTDNVLGLYYLADKYNMPHPKEICAEFIKKSLSPSIVCDVFQLAVKHRDADMLEYTIQYCIDHASEILLSEEWLSFMKSNTEAANELLIHVVKKMEEA